MNNTAYKFSAQVELLSIAPAKNTFIILLLKPGKIFIFQTYYTMVCDRITERLAYFSACA